MIDADDVNVVCQEERAYYKWERETKNKILAMVNPRKKQMLWSKYFPAFEHDESYLFNGLIY